jgi:hypothetical protein
MGRHVRIYAISETTVPILIKFRIVIGYSYKKKFNEKTVDKISNCGWIFLQKKV